MKDDLLNVVWRNGSKPSVHKEDQMGSLKLLLFINQVYTVEGNFISSSEQIHYVYYAICHIVFSSTIKLLQHDSNEPILLTT